MATATNKTKACLVLEVHGWIDGGGDEQTKLALYRKSSSTVPRRSRQDSGCAKAQLRLKLCVRRLSPRGGLPPLSYARKAFLSTQSRCLRRSKVLPSVPKVLGRVPATSIRSDIQLRWVRKLPLQDESLVCSKGTSTRLSGMVLTSVPMVLGCFPTGHPFQRY